MFKPILCLDFDGVIHSYTSGWQGARNIPDPPVEGALQFMLQALEQGYDVVVHSSRASHLGGIWAMRRWLRKHSAHIRVRTLRWDEAYQQHYEDFYEDDVWDRDQWGMPSLCDVRFVRMKPPAVVTIDDRAVRFDGNFQSPRAYMSLKPWNKA